AAGNGSRWISSLGFLWGSARALSDAVEIDHFDRHIFGHDGGVDTAANLGCSCEYGNTLTVCDRVCRRAGHTSHAATCGAAVPLSTGATGADPRCHFLRAVNVLVACGKLAAAGDLAADWFCDLLQLWTPPQCHVTLVGQGR